MISTGARAIGRSGAGQAGVTLMEMLVVVAIIALMVGLTFPSMTAGVDSLRLTTAADSIVSFLNLGLNRAERRQQVIEVVILRAENALALYSVDGGPARRLQLPDGVTIAAIYPGGMGEMEAARSIMLYPGGTPPRIGIEIVNRRNDRRLVRIDPTTGVAQIERPGMDKKGT